MATYEIKETQGINDSREGRTVNVKTLAHAKANASRGQCFYGTWLHIYDEKGNHLSRRGAQTNKWEDTAAK